MNERDDQGRGPAGRPLDGMGHDAAHGHRGQSSDYQGGSVGRSTARAGDDLTSDDRPSDDATRRSDALPPRGEIIPGKGFDAGGGYGGAGNASAYTGESSYGGHSRLGGNTMRGAHPGEGHGRQGESDTNDGGTSGGSGAPRGADVPRGTDEEGGERGRKNAGGSPKRDDANVVDLDVQPDAGRREPTER